MKKTKSLLLLILILLFNLCPANATTQLKIKVNNKIISSDVEPFIKNGTTYVPIRFVSEALNADKIIWNEKSKAVLIAKDSTQISLIINKNYAYVNNTYTPLDSNAIISKGRTFVPLRFISNCFGANVEWNQDTNTVYINTSSYNDDTTSRSGTTSSRNDKNTNSIENYTEDELYWLSRIIEAEAAGESFKGKIAVGEVILNRVESADFPNTIWGVIFDNKFGVQFEPTSNGTIYNNPSTDSINAAKTALSGSNYVGNCLYFLNPTIAESKWIVNNREFFTTIGQHDFYL